MTFRLMTLTATQEIEIDGLYKGFKKTILRNEKDDIVATYPASMTQPHRNKKTIIHNCFRYKLIWKPHGNKKRKD
mgnify:CR=1 FL=1